MEKRCENCKYWIRHRVVGPPAPWGSCKRYPQWGLYREDNWCGEFEPKKQPARIEIEKEEEDDREAV